MTSSLLKNKMCQISLHAALFGTLEYFSCIAHILEQFGVHLHYFWPEILCSVKKNKRRMHFSLTRSFLIKTKVKAWHLDVPSEKVCTSLWMGCHKSHYTEVTQGVIFMEQNMGWFWAGWQYWKKNWADYEQLFRSFLSCFYGEKDIFKLFKKYCSVRTKMLHKMKVKKM